MNNYILLTQLAEGNAVCAGLSFMQSAILRWHLLSYSGQQNKGRLPLQEPPLCLSVNAGY